MQNEPKYPEHIKLGAVKNESQIIGDFLENLADMNLVLADIDGSDGHLETWPTRRRIDQILAQYFGIDLKKIEQEKQQMLDTIRRNNAEDRELGR